MAKRKRQRTIPSDGRKYSPFSLPSGAEDYFINAVVMEDGTVHSLNQETEEEQLTMLESLEQPYVRVRLDEATGEMAARIAEGLRASRGVKDANNVTKNHSLIRKIKDAYRTYIASLDDEPADEEVTGKVIFMIEDAIQVPSVDACHEMLVYAMESWEKSVVEDALMAGIFHENFRLTRQSRGFAIELADHVPEFDPQEDFDASVFQEDEDEWIEYVALNGALPPPTPDRNNAAEVRVQIMKQFFAKYRFIQLRIGNIMERMVNLIIYMTHGDTFAGEDADEIGFHITGLDEYLAEVGSSNAPKQEGETRNRTVAGKARKSTGNTRKGPKVSQEDSGAGHPGGSAATVLGDPGSTADE